MIFQNFRLFKYFFMMTIFFSPSLCFAEAYSVAKGDKLKISIFQWPQYSGESRVDDSGTISLPIMGIRRLPVSGLGLAQIEQKILEKLSTLTEMRNVVVFVDVAEYRPISVLGAVNTPGRYGYSSGTSVLHAVAMAGGLLVPTLLNASQEGDPLRRFVDQTKGRERLDALNVQLWGAVARRARLLADRNGLKVVKFPIELLEYEKNSSKRNITQREIKLFEADKRQFGDEIRILNEQILIVEKEIEILRVHLKDVGTSVKKLELQLKHQSSLVGKGLARRLTIMTVDSRLADMRGEYRRTAVSLMRSRTNLSNIEKNILTAKSQRERKIESALVKTESEIDIVNDKMRHQKSILPNQLGASIGTDYASENELVVDFSIVRDAVEGQKREIAAEDTTLLMPGDILKVRLSNGGRDDGPVGATEIPSAAQSSACGLNELGAVIETRCPADATSARPVVGSSDITMGGADVR